MRLTFFLFFISFSFFAQNNTGFDRNSSSTTDNFFASINSGNGTWIVSSATSVVTEGSVFLFSTWENLYVIESVQGNSFSINNLNYNIETTEIETKFSKDSLFQFNKADISFVHVNNKKYKLIDNKLYEVLYTGEKYSLFKSFKVFLMKGVLNPLTHTSSPDSYIKKSEYFYILNYGSFLEFKLKKNEVLSMMKDKEKEVKVFVSKNSLSYSKEEDIVKIFKNFNY